MNLTFFNRTPLRSIGAPTLTIAAEGAITLSEGLIEPLQLRRLSPVHLVRDNDTRRWYLCFGEVEGQKPATLGKKNKSGGLTFSHRPAAKQFYEQFRVSAERKSLSLPVVTTPTLVDALQLYALDTSKLGLALVPTLPAEFAEPVVMAAVVDTIGAAPEADTMSAPEDTASAVADTPSEPAPLPEVPTPAPIAGKLARPEAYTEEQKRRILAEGGTKEGRIKLATEFDRTVGAIYATYYALTKQQPKEPEQVKPYVPVAKRVAEKPAAAPAPALGDKLLGRDDDRAQELGMYWYEREMGLATDKELQELGQVLSAIPAGQRGFHLSTTLERAKQEAARRRLQLAA